MTSLVAKPKKQKKKKQDLKNREEKFYEFAFI